MTIKNHLMLAAVMFCTVIATVVTYDALGTKRLAAEPTSIATIDLARVLDRLQQRATAEANLQEMGAGVQAELDNRQTQLRETQAKLEGLSAEERRETENQIMTQLFETEQWAGMQQNQIDIEKALMLENLYKSIRQAATRLCDQEGYDLVIVNDATGEFEKNPELNIPRSEQIRRQIRSRRVLVTSDRIDITDQLVTIMNNEFNFGG